MWKKLFLKLQYACFLMLDCNCSRDSFGLSSCLIALYNSPGFIAKDKIGQFQDMAQAFCPFSSSCLTPLPHCWVLVLVVLFARKHH